MGASLYFDRRSMRRITSIIELNSENTCPMSIYPVQVHSIHPAFKALTLPPFPARYQYHRLVNGFGYGTVNVLLKAALAAIYYDLPTKEVAQ